MALMFVDRLNAVDRYDRASAIITHSHERQKALHVCFNQQSKKVPSHDHPERTDLPFCAIRVGTPAYISSLPV